MKRSIVGVVAIAMMVCGCSEKVRQGAFISYSGEMPPLSIEALPDADLADILQYLDLYKTP